MAQNREGNPKDERKALEWGKSQRLKRLMTRQQKLQKADGLTRSVNQLSVSITKYLRKIIL